MTGYRLAWHPGPSAQIEIFSPPAGQTGFHQIKYTPPFHSTIRPPLQRSNLGPGEFRGLDHDLERLAPVLDARYGQEGADPSSSGDQDTLADLATLGGLLFNYTLPRYVRSELQDECIYLEIGMDESLLGYPWELMHDGEEFLCLRHCVGRFVNAASATNQPVARSMWQSAKPERLSMLLISVPAPQPRSSQTFDRLTAAEAETEAIIETLQPVREHLKLDVLARQKATLAEVFRTLQKNEYQIIHFCGHARFRSDEPRLSSLALHDQDMTTGAVVSFISEARPVLCFINACESAKAVAAKERLDIYGLAQALLETGAYLLGSRLRVDDEAAAVFARTFYGALFKEGKPLGEAIRGGRVACKKARPDAFAWASYVLYGDPRVCFKAGP
jgi:CHAT domain-containing protein